MKVFRRGCLKGEIRFAPGPLRRKCEPGDRDCNERNRRKVRFVSFSYRNLRALGARTFLFQDCPFLFPIRRISPSDDDRDWTAVRTTLVRYICGHTGQSGLAEEVAQETQTRLITLQQRGEIGCADAGLSADRLSHDSLTYRALPATGKPLDEVDFSFNLTGQPILRHRSLRLLP